MKTILSVILTATLVSSTVIAAPGNNDKKTVIAATTVATNDVFARFNTHRQKDGVAVQFTVNNIDQINSFIIERSWDGVYFETINVIEASQSMNRYLDNNEVYPGNWYYRVTAVMNDGTEVSSEVDQVRIVRNG